MGLDVSSFGIAETPFWMSKAVVSSRGGYCSLGVQRCGRASDGCGTWSEGGSSLGREERGRVGGSGAACDHDLTCGCDIHCPSQPIIGPTCKSHAEPDEFPPRTNA